MRVKRRSQPGDEVGQRVTEVLVLAAPETVPGHHHPAAEEIVARVERRQGAALGRRDQALDNCATVGVEVVGDSLPIDRRDAFGNLRRRRDGGRVVIACVQAASHP